MRYVDLAKSWAILVGIILLVAGVAGFVPNGLVGRPDSLLPTDRVHDSVHIVTGLIALGIGLGLRGMTLANAVLGFGVLYAIIFLGMLVSPTLFGLVSVPANGVVHVVHAAVALVSLAVGYLARSEETADVGVAQTR
jgi:hypothetical protein